MTFDPMTARALMESHYLVFAFLASLGTMQIAVSISGIKGLWLTPNRLLTRSLGIALLATSIVIFFAQPLWVEGPWAEGSVEADSATRLWGTASLDELAAARNVNDIHGGMAGTNQAIWFPIGAALAFTVSGLVGSVTAKATGSKRSTSDDDAVGLEALKSRNYFKVLPSSWRSFRSEIAVYWRIRLAGSDGFSIFRILFGRNSG
ncbi:MAG: hypothetical protein VW271_03345 [Chloroflexota bacterium]